MSENSTDRFGFVSDDVKEYISLRITSLKLAAVENLSSLLSSAFGIMIFVVCITFSLMLLTIALTLLIGYLIGNIATAFAIMGGVFLIISIIAYLLRDRLITDSLVARLSKMFFTTRKNESDDETR